MHETVVFPLHTPPERKLLSSIDTWPHSSATYVWRKGGYSHVSDFWSTERKQIFYQSPVSLSPAYALISNPTLNIKETTTDHCDDAANLCYCLVCDIRLGLFRTRNKNNIFFSSEGLRSFVPWDIRIDVRSLEKIFHISNIESLFLHLRLSIILHPLFRLA